MTPKAEREIKRALVYAGRLISERTKKNFKATGIGQSLAKGIGYRLWRKDLGVYAGLRGEYRLNFFEVGTKPRYVKKGYYRGKIKPFRFFRSAVDSELNKGVRYIQKAITRYDLFKDFTIRVSNRS